MKRLTIEIEEDLKREFHSEAVKEGKTLKEKIIELIHDYLQKAKEKL